MSGIIRDTGVHGSGRVSGELEGIGNFIGMVQPFGTATAPTGWLKCDGTSYNRADYPSLFAAIGTTWGSASGTTFNVPRLQGAFVRGTGSHTSQMGNTNAFNGSNIGTMANDQVQNFNLQAQSGIIKIGGPTYNGSFIGRSIGNHGMAFRTGTFYYDHTQGGNAPFTGSKSLNRTMTDGGGTDATSGGTRRSGGESKPFSCSVEYMIYAGKKGT